MTPNPQPYARVRSLISSADLLLFRAGPLPSSQMIAAGGRSIYSHVAMAGWWGPRLMALEMREWVGGRAISLSNYVEQYPGRIDVYRAALSPGEREAALDAMKDITGRAYGWATIAWHLLRQAPVIRWFVSAPNNDTANGNLLVCSSAVAFAYRNEEHGAGVDPVPELSDRATTPGDLARSMLFEYRFTLGLPVNQEAVA